MSLVASRPLAGLRDRARDDGSGRGGKRDRARHSLDSVARQRPERARRGPGRARALGRLDHEHAAVYCQIIYNALRDPMRRAIRGGSSRASATLCSGCLRGQASRGPTAIATASRRARTLRPTIGGSATSSRQRTLPTCSLDALHGAMSCHDRQHGRAGRYARSAAMKSSKRSW